MKVFVISLKRSVKRRMRMQKLLDDAGIIFEFFDAVDGSSDNFKHLDKQCPVKTKQRLGYTLTKNELACYASHYSMWDKCIQLNEPILVLEDNCDITKLLSLHIKNFKVLVNKYQFIKLFAFFKQTAKEVEVINDSLNIVSYTKRGSGAQGYLLSPLAARKLITNAQKFIEAVDDYMEKPWRHGVKAYYFNPDIVTRAKVTSTIGSNRKNKTGLTLANKLQIELFRLYEQLRYKLYR